MKQQLQQIYTNMLFHALSVFACAEKVFYFLLVWWAVPILSSDMLEGLLHQTSMVQGEVVQWGAEQEVVVQWDRGLVVAEDRMCGTGGQHIVQSGIGSHWLHILRGGLWGIGRSLVHGLLHGIGCILCI